jgi:hypothetical protein
MSTYRLRVPGLDPSLTVEATAEQWAAAHPDLRVPVADVTFRVETIPEAPDVVYLVKTRNRSGGTREEILEIPRASIAALASLLITAEKETR